LAHVHYEGHDRERWQRDPEVDLSGVVTGPVCDLDDDRNREQCDRDDVCRNKTATNPDDGSATEHT
jgi:hypothetical protein